MKPAKPWLLAMSLNEAYEIEANREGYIERGDQALVDEAEAVIEEQRIREYDECVTHSSYWERDEPN